MLNVVRSVYALSGLIGGMPVDAARNASAASRRQGCQIRNWLPIASIDGRSFASPGEYAQGCPRHCR